MFKELLLNSSIKENSKENMNINFDIEAKKWCLFILIGPNYCNRWSQRKMKVVCFEFINMPRERCFMTGNILSVHYF